MKTIYLENTNNHHDKFYHMIENKDGASFTASWGRIGTNGRTQIYGINEWKIKYGEKINKGYKVSTNGIQNMSVAQRKKQGITTVQPFYQPKKSKKNPDNKIHYSKDLKSFRVGQVDVEVNHSHKNKLLILKMTMENWAYNNGRIPMDSRQGRLYEADLDRVNTLLDVFTKIDDDKHLLTKEEMYEMNVIFKTYGGTRKTNDKVSYTEQIKRAKKIVTKK